MNPDFLAKLLAALGQQQPDATRVDNRPQYPSPRSVGPVTQGNRPLPETTVQSQYRPRYDKAMGVLSDLIPVLGELRGLQAGHQTAQAGNPFLGAMGAAASVVPLGGRIFRTAEGAVASHAPAAIEDLMHVDPGLHSRLLNTPDGSRMGNLGSYLKDERVRALYADALDTPVYKLSTPPHGTPTGTEFRGAFGSYRGQPAIFMPAQPHTEFGPALLEEGAHALRHARGRVDAPQTFAGGFDFDAYRALPAEQSAEKLVQHVLSLPKP